MSAQLLPRRTFHRGFVVAGGFWFDPLLLGEEKMADRILSLWREGCVIHAVADGVLFVLPSPILVESRCAPGVVLTRRDGLLVGLPLTEGEFTRLDPPSGCALLCREGRIRACRLTRETILDPAAWLDVSDYVAQESFALGDPPARAAAARSIEPAPFESHFDPELTRPAEEKIKLLEALAKADSQRKGAGKAWPWASLPRWLSSLFGYSTGGKVPARIATPERHVPSRPRAISWLAHRIARMRQFLGSWLLRSPVARLMGRPYARYLDKLKSLFEENNLDQALRYAIPFGTLREMVRAVPSLRPPTPRSNLSVTTGYSSGAVRVLPMTEDYWNYLKDLYRQAFERLERAGEIEKAAFVLLELLRENEEAIALLERHSRFRFAAEIAQARELPPGMVVRLWFLAGEPSEAIRVARATGAFADAVSRLERTHKEEAKKLRIIWAAFLAEAGNYGAAVDAAWTVPEARNLIPEWIERGIRLEGAIAARLMVKKIVLAPGSLEGVLPKIREVVHDELPEGMRAKLSLGKAILEHKDREDLRAISGFVLRELLKDLHSIPFNPGFEAVVKGLKKITPDRLLVEDFPRERFPTPETASKECVIFRRDAADVGLHRLYDGVCLPSGRLLVALGEAGVQVLSRRGALIAHVDCPADQLVVNDSGNRVIAVARRGRVCRLSRIDLETLRERYWCDAEIGVAADTYDGEVWFASHENTLMAIDALSARFESIWRVGDLDGPVAAMARNSSALGLLVATPVGPEQWTYNLPPMVLRRRHAMFRADDRVRLWAVMPKGYYGVCIKVSGGSPGHPDRYVVRIGREDLQSIWQSREIEELPQSLNIYDHGCVLATETVEGRRILFFRSPPGTSAEPAVQLDLLGSRSVRFSS